MSDDTTFPEISRYYIVVKDKNTLRKQYGDKFIKVFQFGNGSDNTYWLDNENLFRESEDGFLDEKDVEEKMTEAEYKVYKIKVL